MGKKKADAILFEIPVKIPQYTVDECINQVYEGLLEEDVKKNKAELWANTLLIDALRTAIQEHLNEAASNLDTYACVEKLGGTRGTISEIFKEELVAARLRYEEEIKAEKEREKLEKAEAKKNGRQITISIKDLPKVTALLHAAGIKLMGGDKLMDALNDR